MKFQRRGQANLSDLGGGLEEKMANRRLKWSELATKYSDPELGFPPKFESAKELERAVRRLKVLLSSVSITLSAEQTTAL
jgi:hypothetical protein